jgi:putative hydrolases of HD superfamily
MSAEIPQPAATAIPLLADFLIDVERLKLVERKACVSDHTRRENSAEHSWHLTLGLLALARELQLPIEQCVADGWLRDA